MKKSNLVLKMGLAAILAGNLGTAVAVNPGVGTAQATVVETLNVAEDARMDFGNIGAGAAVSTLILNPSTNAIAEATGDAVSFGNVGTAGAFTITGGIGKTVAVDMTTTSATLEETGRATMLLDTFTGDGALAGIWLVDVAGVGTATIKLGGTLHVGANQAAGDYEASTTIGTPYAVTVSYE